MPSNTGHAKKIQKPKKIVKLDQRNIEPEFQGGAHYESDELTFALDIGTRTVVGIVGVQEAGKFKVLAAEVVEHKNRAMLDGQIHDIQQVSEVAKEVKSKLESKLGVQLSKVAIAAAGRVLKTCQVSVEREIEQGKEIDQELVSSIEVEGIQKAQLKLDEEISQEERTQFYCVGYSVINYYLNGYVISSILGHKGKKIGANILATFLPHIVVDSLYTVMNKVGLEVVSLTLEPIAAINVTIPKDLRLLNLALVDIGAGTSDIAITKDGSVVAYAMAPTAGDEITERIAQHYLVDFNTGETIKISLSSSKDVIRFIDILGKKHTMNKDEVSEIVKPSVELLAATISQKIIEYNHKAPNAIFLIGGGSQIPGLTDSIAEYLKLPKDRVVVRGRDILQDIKFSGKKLMGPEAITPFGIAVTAQKQKGQDFLSVILNGRKLRLFNSKKLTVADALILIGFDPGQLIGRTGKSVTFELNGTKRVVRGEPGKPAEISVNGLEANLETILKADDDIRVIPAVNGKDAQVTLSDYINDLNPFKVFLNGTPVDAGVVAYINGQVVEKGYRIIDGDKVHVAKILSIRELSEISEINLDDFEIVREQCAAAPDDILKPNEHFDIRLKEKTGELIESDKFVSHLEDKPVPNTEASAQIEPAAYETLREEGGLGITVNGKRLILKGDKLQYIFVDVFNFIDFDLSKPQGNIALKLNGVNASFTDVIKAGDCIEIYWDK